MSKSTIDLASLAALAVTYSSYMNPRHLEYFLYPLYAKTAQSTIPADADSTHVACQHPLYISAKPFADPDTSTDTQPDNTAQGVLVDAATIFVQLDVHPEADVPAQYDQKTLENLLQDICEGVLHVSPRFFSIRALQAASLWEAKHGPSRHTKNVSEYAKDLHKLMGSARDRTYLVAAVGEYLSLRIFTRDDAEKALQGVQRWRDSGLGTPDHEEYGAVVSPAKVKATKEEQDKARAERYAKYVQNRAEAQKRQQHNRLTPNDKRSVYQYSPEDLNGCWALMETRSAHLFFKIDPEQDPEKRNGWSGAKKQEIQRSWGLIPAAPYPLPVLIQEAVQNLVYTEHSGSSFRRERRLIQPEIALNGGSKISRPLEYLYRTHKVPEKGLQVVSIAAGYLFAAALRRKQLNRHEGKGASSDLARLRAIISVASEVKVI
ncbi:hypothetical protein C8R47DRAFT_1322992 [Mycena vitilis]|nr:hypothetical protein C8R47DRAFT_1322992 [Mycena vitilis]